MADRPTVIVSTYNQPEYLSLVLASIAVQTHRDLEVVVADDGSSCDNRAIIDRHAASHGLDIRHVWHEDKGFRKTLILNQAVAQARGEKLIFTDGDCILHPRYVEEHLRLLRPGRFCVGRTPRFSRVVSEKITEADVLARRAQRVTAAVIWDGIFGKSRKIEFGFYLGSEALFSLARRLKKRLDLWGGNFSCYRVDFIAVNGYNEDFIGWGQEDSELGVRLKNLGRTPFLVANRAINFHLWHPVSNQQAGKADRHRMKWEIARAGTVRAANGIDKYLA